MNRLLYPLAGLAIVGAALLLRLYRLAELPPGLILDEGLHGIDALSIWQGRLRPFYPEAGGRGGLYAFLVAAVLPWLGRTALTIRLPAALASTFAVAGVWWLGAVLFPAPHPSGQNPGRQLAKGQFVGLAAAGLMAVSLALTILGRTGWRANLLLCLLVGGLALLWSGFRQHSPARLILAGVCVGLLPYTYPPAYFVPLLLAAIGLTGWLLQPPASPAERRRRLGRGAIFLASAGAIALPFFVYFLLFPSHLTVRSAELSVFNPAVHRGNLLARLGQNLLAHLAAFGWQGDPRPQLNQPGMPLLNWLEALLFWAGLGLAAWHWRRPAYRLLLLWFVVLLIPPLLAFDNPPNFLRLLAVTPAVYLLSGLAAWHTWDWLAGWERSGPRRAAQLVFAGLIVAALAGRGVQTFRIYFHQWATDPAVAFAYQTHWTQLAQGLENTPPASATGEEPPVYLVPYSNFNRTGRVHNFEFLYTGDTPVHLIHAARADLPEAVRELLQTGLTGGRIDSPSGGFLGDVRLIEWTVAEGADPTRRLLFLLQKYGQLAQIEEHPDYRLYRFQAVDVSQPWQLASRFDPLPIVYDGGIGLEALAIGRANGPQLSAGGPNVVPPGARLWLALRWRASGQPGGFYRLSFRLHNAGGERVYQLDDGLWNVAGRPAEDWSPGETTESLHSLALPSDLPAGSYELRLVVYDEPSGTPTVEIGTWRAEVPIARLEIQPNESE